MILRRYNLGKPLFRLKYFSESEFGGTLRQCVAKSGFCCDLNLRLNLLAYLGRTLYFNFEEITHE